MTDDRETKQSERRLQKIREEQSRLSEALAEQMASPSPLYRSPAPRAPTARELQRLLADAQARSR